MLEARRWNCYYDSFLFTGLGRLSYCKGSSINQIRFRPSYVCLDMVFCYDMQNFSSVYLHLSSQCNPAALSVAE